MTMRRLERVVSSQRGQTLVLVGVVMLVLLGLAAMAVDVGEVLWSRGAEQNAADAGALAGVRELPASPATAPTVGVQYAAQNGFGASSPPAAAVATVTANYSTTFNSNDTLTVTVNRDIPGGLRQAVGGGNINVPAEAVAIVAPALPTCGYWPWAIEENVLLYKDLNNPGATPIYYSDTYGQEVILKEPTRDQGSFLVIDVGNGDLGYRTAIEEGMCMPSNPTGHDPDLGNTTRDAVYNAIEVTVPGYNPGPPGNPNPTPPSDNVFWPVSPDSLVSKGGPGSVYTFDTAKTPPYYDPATGGLVDPYTGQKVLDPNGQLLVKPNGDPYWTDLPFALGPAACGGSPTQANPFPMPTVTWIQDPNNPANYLNPCPRVGLVGIMPAGSVNACPPGNNSNCPIVVEHVAVFYLIGMEQVNSKWYPVGAFLKVAQASGPPDYGGSLDGPINYFLWR